jgi:hypothetical protein
MRRPGSLRAVVFILLLLGGVPSGASAGTSTGAVDTGGLPPGVWSGERNGQSVTWKLDDAGRLRLDGRPADYLVAGDTVIVRFDAPAAARPGTLRETAVYRFLASTTPPPRLFVYGFDLGIQGLWLEREAAGDPPLPEDTSPPVPPPGADGGKGAARVPPVGSHPMARAQPGGHK